MSEEAAAPKVRSGSDQRQRGRMLSLRVTADEHAQLSTAAERAGLSLGSYLRGKAIAAPQTRPQRRPPAADVEALARIFGQLGKVGSNLNQIARALNSGADTPPFIAETVAEVRSCSEEIRLAMGKRPRAGRS